MNSQFATFNPAMAMSRDGDLYASVLQKHKVTILRLSNENVVLFKNVSANKHDSMTKIN